MNRVNHTFSSIEQVTDQFLTTKNQKNLEKSSEISCVWKTEISI